MSVKRTKMDDWSDQGIAKLVTKCAVDGLITGLAEVIICSAFAQRVADNPAAAEVVKSLLMDALHAFLTAEVLVLDNIIKDAIG